MTPAARIGAAIHIMDRILAGEFAERVIKDWGRKNRYAGSKDRAAIGDIVFDVLRKRSSFEASGGGVSGRALLLGYVRANGEDPETLFGAGQYAPTGLTAVERASGQPGQTDVDDCADFPDWLWPVMVQTHGAQALPIAQALREKAPVFSRVNLRKVTREQAAEALAKEGIVTRPHFLSPSALQVVEGARRIKNSVSYQNGTIELQDASSQAVADLVPLKPGQSLLDYCAGAGGKVLSVAGRIAGTYFAHDANPHRMKDLPVRAARAGVHVSHLSSKDLEEGQRFDTVLVDAPCSGSGSWRRDPQGKWLLTPDLLDNVLSLQGEILDQAARLVKPDGHLVYATCSLLDCENDVQAKDFLLRNSDFAKVQEEHFTPLTNGDGFYCAVFCKA